MWDFQFRCSCTLPFPPRNRRRTERGLGSYFAAAWKKEKLFPFCILTISLPLHCIYLCAKIFTGGFTQSGEDVILGNKTRKDFLAKLPYFNASVEENVVCQTADGFRLFKMVCQKLAANNKIACLIVTGYSSYILLLFCPLI